jgi:hypothetical protein
MGPYYRRGDATGPPPSASASRVSNEVTKDLPRPGRSQANDFRITTEASWILKPRFS